MTKFVDHLLQHSVQTGVGFSGTSTRIANTRSRVACRGTLATVVFMEMCVCACSSPATENMCSKCFKATHPSDDSPVMRTKVSSSQISVTPATVTPAAAVAAAVPAPEAAAGSQAAVAAAAVAAAVASTPSTSTPKKKKKKKSRKRCFECNTRVGLTGFKCKCENVFCDTHRYADAHNCGYDFASEHREQLKKLNPKVVASKLDRV